MRDCVLVLHNIRSAHNVGSMFRTADGAGVSRIILSGYTPGVTDSRGKVLSAVLKKLKKGGYTIIALEQNKSSKSLFDYSPIATEKLAVVMGNEVRGIN